MAKGVCSRGKTQAHNRNSVARGSFPPLWAVVSQCEMARSQCASQCLPLRKVLAPGEQDSPHLLGDAGGYRGP